jgi:hypothetical protein
MAASRLLCTLEGVEVMQDADGRVHFTADADIDADGANGQSFSRDGRALFAYAPNDLGLDALANAGYPNNPAAYQDILVCSGSGRPVRFVVSNTAGYYSRTAYINPHSATVRDMWLDSVSVPYIVVSPLIRKLAKGVVLGCLGRVSLQKSGQLMPGQVDCMVGDIGPTRRIGELSIATADALGIDSNARTGGLEARVVYYELWPGIPARLNGQQYALIPM